VQLTAAAIFSKRKTFDKQLQNVSKESITTSRTQILYKTSFHRTENYLGQLMHIPNGMTLIILK